jgi:peptide deformylase
MATKLKVRLYGDPCLRQKSSPVKNVGVSERVLIEAMIETMYEYKGVGLAAPQVGVNERIFVADVGEGPMVFVNPKIVDKRGSGKLDEGCLSIPGVNVAINRPETITVQYIDQNNKPRTMTCDELLARVVQHETDHLLGKLIVDYADEETMKKIKPVLEEIEKQRK